MPQKNKTVVVIPCFKVKKKILHVVKKCIKYFDYIICVDDCCPENSGNYIKRKFKKMTSAPKGPVGCKVIGECTVVDDSFCEGLIPVD